MSIFWPPVLNSFWRNSENRGELSHKSSNYWQQPAVLLRLNNESKPKTKWSYWPVSSLLAVTVVWSSIVVSEQNLQISAFRVFRVVSVAIYWHHIVTVPVWAEWWMMWAMTTWSHLNTVSSELPYNYTRKNYSRLFNFPRCAIIRIK